MKRATINDLIIDVVLDESVTESSDITNYTVETLEQFIDHHSIQPTTLSISGVFAQKGSDIKLKKLRQFQNDSVLVRYSGRNIFNNMIITSINRNHSKDNGLGFGYDIKMVQINSQVAQRIEIKVINPKTKVKSAKTSSKTKKVSNKGRVQVKNTKQSSKTSRVATTTEHNRYNKTLGKKNKWDMLPPSITGLKSTKNR